MPSAPADLGPVLPSPATVWSTAKEIGRLAEEAKRFADDGPQRDLTRALKQFDHIRALLGEGNPQ